MNRVTVKEAIYETEFRLRIKFSDKTEQVVDFKPFLEHKRHEVFERYKQLKNFKRFKIERGNIVWGKDWDLIFPIEELYQGNISI